MRFTVLREASDKDAGLIMAFVPKKLMAAQEGFSFALPKEALIGAASDVPVRVSTMDDQPLPSWLRFDEAKRLFVATTVPPQGLPLRVQIHAGGRRSVVNLVEVDN